MSASLHCSPSSALKTCSKPLDSSSLSSPRLGQSLRCWALGALMGPVQRIFHCLPSHSQVWAREPEAQPTTGFQAKRGGKRQVPATGARLNCDGRYCQTLGPALAPKGARRNTSLPAMRTCLLRRTPFSRSPWALFPAKQFFLSRCLFCGRRAVMLPREASASSCSEDLFPIMFCCPYFSDLLES